MQRTISVMVGKGSINHNSRKFHAANTDKDRFHLNCCYCNEDIRQVYHELFDEAVQRYNEKQTRNDRVVTDYYKKICSGKQEKPFHEIILQIGNCEDMNAKMQDGKLAQTVLDEYMQTFQARNPNLLVFSAHLHMDEATPHLHIDFVPFTTDSKRGLDTRVSLKKALDAQGFKGGSRRETEWNQWVSSEKEYLATVMERRGIEWEKKGIHEKHLSVLDYTKKMRFQEVAELESKIDELQVNVQEVQKAKQSADKIQIRLEKLKEHESTIGLYAGKYDVDPEWQLPEPSTLMSAKSYKAKVVVPLISRFKDVVRSLVAQYLELSNSVDDLWQKLLRAHDRIERLTERMRKVEQENSKLMSHLQDYKLVRKVLGKEKLIELLDKVQAEELTRKRPIRSRSEYER